MTPFRHVPDVEIELPKDSAGFEHSLLFELNVGPQWKEEFIQIYHNNDSIIMTYQEAEMLRDWLNRALQPSSATGDRDG